MDRTRKVGMAAALVGGTRPGKGQGVRMTMRAIIVAFLGLSLVLALSATALASPKAPQGKGLNFMTDDYHFSNVVCDDPSVEDILLPAGYTGWVLGDGGDVDRHYVVRQIIGEVVATFPDQTTQAYGWSQNFGKKSGKTSETTCSVDFSHEHGGVSEVGEMTFIMVRVW